MGEFFACFNLDNCLVCGQYMGTFKNDLSVSTAYSENTVLQIIKKILDFPISDVVKDGGICQNCFIKFNEYDEFQAKADGIKSDLISMITRAAYVECKEEEEDQIEEQIIYTDFDEDMVEYSEIQEHFQIIKEEDSPKEECTAQKDDIKDEGLVITVIDNNIDYKCEICGRVFVSQSRLKSHKLLSHSEDRIYKCYQCKASFKKLRYLKSHFKSHMNIYFHCDLCACKFKSKHELGCHMEAIHLKKKDHVCKFCGKAFSRYKTLRQHLLYHSNKREFVCEICGFSTISLNKLKRHLKSHTKQRDYECPICKKRFLYSYNVNAHIRYVHAKEKKAITEVSKLTCYVCGKKHQLIWKLKEHMREEHKTIEENAVFQIAYK